MKTVQCHIPDHDLIMSIVINSAFITYRWLKTDALLSNILISSWKYFISVVWVTTYISQFCQSSAHNYINTLQSMYSSVTSLYCVTRRGTWLSNVYSYSKPGECHALGMQYAQGKWEMHTKLKSININGKYLCTTGSIILNCILKKMLTQLIWGNVSGLWTKQCMFMQKQNSGLFTHSLKLSLSLKGLNILIWHATFSSQWKDWAHCCLQHEPLNKSRTCLIWLSQTFIGSWL